MLIPARFIGELRALPEEVLSATEAVSEVRSQRAKNRRASMYACDSERG